MSVDSDFVLKNANNIYYILSILAILYTIVAFSHKKIKNHKITSYLKSFSEVPEKINEITKSQKEIFSEIRLQNKTINAVVDSLEIAQFISDADGRCIQVNAKWVSLTGLTESEASGYKWLISVHPDDRADIEDKWHKMVDSKAAFEETFRYKNRVTGEVTHVKCTATDINDDNNQRVFILGFSKVLGK